MLRWVVAAVHLLALPVGFVAVWTRSRALRAPLDAEGIRRVLHADTVWGLAALVWIATGLARTFGGLEKGSTYYLHNRLFLLKLALLGLILVLELRPMITLNRWRLQLAKRQPVDGRAAGALATVSVWQAGLVLLMVLAATAMARGYG